MDTQVNNNNNNSYQVSNDALYVQNCSELSWSTTQNPGSANNGLETRFEVQETTARSNISISQRIARGAVKVTVCYMYLENKKRYVD